MRWTAAVLMMGVGWGLPGVVEAQQDGNTAAGASGALDDDRRAPISLARIDGVIDLDGVPDEAAWEAGLLMPVVQYWPEFGAPPSRRTEIRVGYDDDYFYAAGWFWDERAGVRGNSLRRDRWEGDDAFDVIIDSYNDDQTALKFTVTPLGVQLDDEIRNDAQPGDEEPLNRDWNTWWDAATTITDEGWFAEIRIPLSSLGFGGDGSRTVMGLIVGRYIARLDEKHVFPAIRPDVENADFKPSLARDISLQNVTSERPLWVTPYALTGVSRLRDPAAPVPVAPQVDYPVELGADLKYGISSNLTLDLTANTDFAQVENDDFEVNLDRFSLFLPEKRQFFQERSATFGFDMGEGRLFHSRTIGLSEAGERLRIFGGARVAGRVGDWDVGLLSMQVDGDAGQPVENDGVLRLSRTFDRSQQVGGMVTSRVDADGAVDLTLGLDGRVRVGPDLVTIQLAQTRNADDGARSFPDRSAARVFWERRGLDGFTYDIDLMRSGAGYDPTLGFEYRNDFRSLKTRFRYSWQPSPGSLASRVMLIATTRAYVRGSDDRLESGLLRARGWMNLRGGHFVNLAINRTREDVEAPFSLPGATVPAGTYDNLDAYFLFRMSESMPVGSAVTLHAGSAFDGTRTRLTLEPWWRFGQHLTLGGEFSYNRLTFSSRGESVNADYARLRISGALDTRLSAETFVQYSAATDALSTNFRIRYRFSEGRDLYLVLDEGRDLSDRHGLDSSILGRTDRRLLLKYSWAFSPR